MTEKTTYAIRPMTAGDWPQVEAIYRQGIDTGVATFQTDSPSYKEFDAGHHGCCRFVAEEGGAILGWVAVSPVSKREAYRGVVEHSVYVGEACRGTGVGKALLLHLVEAAEQEGFWTLQASIFADNTASLRLHEACGFRRVGVREGIARNRTGRWQDTVLIERRSPRIV